MANNTIIDLRFSTNWNGRSRKGKVVGKLDNLCFSTLRIESPKYQIGQVYRIVLEGNKSRVDEVMGYAKAMVKKVFERDKLTDGMAYLDTGYNRSEVLGILSRMYGNTTPKTVFCFLILKYMTEKEIEEFSKSTQMVLGQ